MTARDGAGRVSALTQSREAGTRMKYEADYVVVGAGAAGSVVAARLAEDGTRSVIVVEAGPDNTADPTISAAAKFPFLLDMPAAVGPHPSPSHWGFVSK